VDAETLEEAGGVVGGGEGADRVDEGVGEEMALGEEVAGEGGLAGAGFAVDEEDVEVGVVVGY